MTDVDWRHLPALTTLRAFEATARMQGYSAAARTLNVTPAAIAQQVRLKRESSNRIFEELKRWQQLISPL